MPRDRTDYLSSVADSWKDQTLLNVVRLRYGDTPSFLDVSSVVSSYAVQGQFNAAGIINSNPTSVAPWNTVTLGTGLTYLDRPTISYTPMAGEKFTRSLLRPINPIGIFQLIQAGYAADFILQVTVRSINGVKNRGTSAAQAQPADPAFYPLLDALRRLQMSEMVSIRLEKRGTEETGILVFAKSRTPEVDADLKFVADTLDIKPGSGGDVAIVFGSTRRSTRELAILSRSMTEILIELASGIEVPAEHLASGRTVPSARLVSAENRRDRPLVRIHSGPTAPNQAFTAVRYRDTWYWIDDGDFSSKRIFTMLMFFFSLAETGVTPQVPALTIPLN